MEILALGNFLRPSISYGDGSGYGYGSGDGDGSGDGYGSGDGDGSGDGYGSGDGSGYGSGYSSGYSSGYGDGSGSGSGSGDGDGDGDGSGDGIKYFNNHKIHNIDSIETILVSIKNDVAKGFILNRDLTLEKCFIVRNDYFFSHGNTLKEALISLEEKTALKMPIEKRIEYFKSKFSDFNLKQKSKLLYDWHFKLTGSCKMGRDNFCKENSINLSKDKLTVNEFISLTENYYGGEIIKMLKHNEKI